MKIVYSLTLIMTLTLSLHAEMTGAFIYIKDNDIVIKAHDQENTLKSYEELIQKISMLPQTGSTNYIAIYSPTMIDQNELVKIITAVQKNIDWEISILDLGSTELNGIPQMHLMNGIPADMAPKNGFQENGSP